MRSFAVGGDSTTALMTGGDADGDGCTEVLLQNVVNEVFSACRPSNPIPIADYGLTYIWWGYSQGRWADFNGDGLGDYLYVPCPNNPGHDALNISTGTSFLVSNPAGLTCGQYGTNQFFTGDFDGDGKSDLIMVDRNGMYVYTWVGGALVQVLSQQNSSAAAGLRLELHRSELQRVAAGRRCRWRWLLRLRRDQWLRDLVLQIRLPSALVDDVDRQRHRGHDHDQLRQAERQSAPLHQVPEQSVQLCLQRYLSDASGGRADLRRQAGGHQQRPGRLHADSGLERTELLHLDLRLCRCQDRSSRAWLPRLSAGRDQEPEDQRCADDQLQLGVSP